MSAKKTIVSLLPLPLSRDTRCLKLAKSFKSAGFRSIVVETRGSPAEWTSPVELITLGARPASGAPEADGQRPIGRGLAKAPMERLHYLRFLFLYHVWMPLRLASVAPKADVYYVHEYRLFPAARCLAARNDARLIYDAHDYYPAVWDEQNLSPFWRNTFVSHLKQMDRLATEAADMVITVGEGVAECIRQAYGATPQIVRNLHDPSLETKSPSLRTVCGLGDDIVLIVAVGNAKTGYDGISLLSAMTKLPKQVHLAFVGRFHDAKEAEIVRLGLEGRVHLPGAVEPGQVVPFIRSADIAALPYTPASLNTRHIMPNGFFQSVAAGLPLLYPNLPDVLAVVNGYEPGLAVDWEDSASIGEALQIMITEDARRARFRQGATDLTEANSWTAEEKRLVSLVSEMLEGNRRIK